MMNKSDSSVPSIDLMNIQMIFYIDEYSNNILHWPDEYSNDILH